jgi:putative FmdB family regulatory protein
MPLYEYHCEKCQHAFDEILPVDQRSKPTTEPCPECGETTVAKGVSVTTMGADMNITPDKKTGGDWSKLMDKMKKGTPKNLHHAFDRSTDWRGGQLNSH